MKILTTNPIKLMMESYTKVSKPKPKYKFGGPVKPGKVTDGTATQPTEQISGEVEQTPIQIDPMTLIQMREQATKNALIKEQLKQLDIEGLQQGTENMSEADRILKIRNTKPGMATGGIIGTPGIPTPIIKNETLRRQKERQDRRSLDIVRNTFNPRLSIEEQFQNQQDKYLIKLLGLTDEQYLNKETPMDEKQGKKAAKFDYAKDGMYNDIANKKRDEILDFKGATYPKPPTDSEAFVNTYEMAKAHPYLQGTDPELYAVSAEKRRDPKNFAALTRFDEHIYNQQKMSYENQDEFYKRKGESLVRDIKKKLIKPKETSNAVKTPMDLMGQIAPNFTTKLLNTLTGGK